MERIHNYLSSPLADKPWKRVGNVHVLAPEVMPPTFYSLTMLAHMPIFRQENYTEMERIYSYISQPNPRQDPVQIVGTKMIEQPNFILGDRLPHRNAVEADIPFALMWLETMARLGFLKRNENWSKMFDRFEDDRGRSGVWHPHKGTSTPTTTNPRVWPMFPLEDLGAGGAKVGRSVGCPTSPDRQYGLRSRRTSMASGIIRCWRSRRTVRISTPWEPFRRYGASLNTDGTANRRRSRWRDGRCSDCWRRTTIPHSCSSSEASPEMMTR
jgi:hypothetical protein